MLLSLSLELEERLVKEAQRRGISPSDLAIQLLNQQLQAERSRQELLGLLKSWIDEAGTEEDRESDSALLRALDEDRLSERKLYPPELKGKTW
jgi:hypothetical protein